MYSKQAEEDLYVNDDCATPRAAAAEDDGARYTYEQVFAELGL